jgi:predicted DNA-binding ribbon-helix-helix protein
MSVGIVKRSVSIAGHRTSVSLEAPFWDALRTVAEVQGRSVQSLIAQIDAERGAQNLSSAIRVFVLRSVQTDFAIPSAGARPEPAPWS